MCKTRTKESGSKLKMVSVRYHGTRILSFLQGPGPAPLLVFERGNGPVPNNITLALPEAIFISEWADQGRRNRVSLA
jgi:hypothetical protein